MQSAHVMLDHPSWTFGEDGIVRRGLRCGATVWLVSARPTAGTWSVACENITGPQDAPEPACDVIDPAELRTRADDPRRLPMTAAAEALRQASTVARLRNPDVWDALATSIVRQVIRAGQARKLYRQFCAEHGERVTTPAGPVFLVPSPETVLSLSDTEYTRLGLAFKRAPLRAAADAHLQIGAKWAELEPTALAAEVQTVPRVGPWTAGATVADLSNDYALYPYADLAVRTWASRLAPEVDWPETEPAFAHVWREITDQQLSYWTLLTLAWGVRHAHGVAL